MRNIKVNDLHDLPDVDEMNEFIRTADAYMEKVTELAAFIAENQPVIDAVRQIG